MTGLIEVKRFKFATDWTLSRYFVNKVLTGFGVEDETRTVKVHGETAIPEGEYPLGFRQSPKFSGTFYWSDIKKILITKEQYNALNATQKKDYRTHDLIWVKKIDNFEYVLIHWGNTDNDTDGCYIVGKALGIIGGQEGVTGSRINYMEMYQKVYPLIKAKGQDFYSIKYTNER